MSYPYADDIGGRRVLSLVRAQFSEGDIYARSDRHIVFVCGGDRKQGNLRSQFLSYAKENLPHLRLLLAEDAYLDLIAGASKKFVNLALFEQLIADISDCVVLFPESPGSFAELGFFSASQSMASKVLAVNIDKFQADDSFINLGPIAIVNSESNYRPTLHVDFEKPNFDFVRKRLERFDASRRRTLVPYKNFSEYDRLQMFFLVFETIRILRIVHAATLPYTLQTIFGGEAVPEDVKHIVAVLVAAGYVSRVGTEQRYLVEAEGVRSFLELPDGPALLAESNLYLLKAHNELYSEIFG